MTEKIYKLRNFGLKLSLRRDILFLSKKMGADTLEQEKIARINFLARKSREEGLTDDEKQEQQLLRNEYRAAIRASLTATLDNIEYQDYKESLNPKTRS